MEKIKALIVEDEPAVRRGVRRQLECELDVEIIGECDNGLQAVSEIQERSPDIVFLDVQMPELDGFGVLELIDPANMPVVVFVTAYDEYAVRAFEAHALDYILKPFNRERFATALGLAREQIGLRRAGGLNHRLQSLLDDLSSSKRYLKRLSIKKAERIILLSVAEIDWVEAADSYVRLHAAGESHVVYTSMIRLEGKLDPDTFLRIHRSLIVNITRIKEVHTLFHGEFVLTLQNGTRLTSGRSYREKLQRLLTNPL